MSDDARLWQVLSEREILQVGGRLSVSLQTVRLPDGVVVDDYLRFRIRPFVTLLALTVEGRVIVERQYKHGPGAIVLTLPAGGIEEGETPEQAARRELIEETGYAAGSCVKLATYFVQSNNSGQTVDLFLATNCVREGEPASGDLEQMTIELLTPGEVLAALQSGDVAVASDAIGILQGMMALGLLVPGCGLPSDL